MELAIGVAIGAVIAVLFKQRKSHKPQFTLVETEDQRKLREADEFVTVILPTINNGK